MKTLTRNSRTLSCAPQRMLSPTMAHVNAVALRTEKNGRSVGSRPRSSLRVRINRMDGAAQYVAIGGGRSRVKNDVGTPVMAGSRCGG
jgi:hypothetical protein